MQSSDHHGRVAYFPTPRARAALPGPTQPGNNRLLFFGYPSSPAIQ